jgi:carbohydrate diacid regulator
LSKDTKPHDPTAGAGDDRGDAQSGSAAIDLEPIGELRTLATGRVARVAREVASQLDGHEDEIAETMLEAYVAEIPAYAGIRDQALRDDVQSVSAALVRCWLTVMSTGEPATPELLRPVLEGVRRRAHQGIELQSVLRAYRVGIRVMWSEITSTHVSQLDGVVGQLATWALDFADRISTAVAGAYLDEAEQLAREREHRRSALLNVILSGPAAETIDPPDELERPHAIAVVRVAPELALHDLERVGQLLEERVGASLWTVRHRSVVASLDASERLDRDSTIRKLRSVLRDTAVAGVGLGGVAEGVQETRDSYAEASSALRVGPSVSEGSAVYDFQDLAPLIALMERPERARRFAAGVLEPLGVLAERPWALPTLEAFLAHRGRVKPAAATLGVHENTVKYRMRELRSFADPAAIDGARAATLLLALRVDRLLRSEPAPRRASRDAGGDAAGMGPRAEEVG